jgi:hypothetical protein
MKNNNFLYHKINFVKIKQQFTSAFTAFFQCLRTQYKGGSTEEASYIYFQAHGIPTKDQAGGQQVYKLGWFLQPPNACFWMLGFEHTYYS